MATELAVHRSRRLIQPFTLHRPNCLDDAITLLGAHGDSARPMAGGIDFIGEMKFGRAVAHVVHLGFIAELRVIRMVGEDLEIGACTTISDLLHDRLVAEMLPDLPKALKEIANIRVRWKATVGGNLLTRNPAYDVAPVLAALGAQLVFALPGGRSVERATADLVGPTPGLLRSVRIHRPAQCRLAYDRTLRPALSVAVGVRLKDGLATSGTGAAGCSYRPIAVSPLPFNAPRSMADIPRIAGDIAAAWARRLPEPAHDWISSAAYRRRMSEVLARRLLTAIGSQHA